MHRHEAESPGVEHVRVNGKVPVLAVILSQVHIVGRLVVSPESPQALHEVVIPTHDVFVIVELAGRCDARSQLFLAVDSTKLQVGGASVVTAQGRYISGIRPFGEVESVGKFWQALLFSIDEYQQTTQIERRQGLVRECRKPVATAPAPPRRTREPPTSAR